jgi:aryl-alcohol dehydrogenase-like predicted oxidoreductase
MKHKQLGSSNLEISVIGLGTWAMGGEGWEFSWGPQDDEESIKTIHKAMEAGINWIDTAAVYGLGHSEVVVGKAIKGMSSKPLIATKCSRLWDEKGDLYSSLKKESVFREAEDSLKRMQIDVIDLYQIHRPMPEEDLEEGWSAMADLVRQGKIRYIGVSNFSVSQIELVKNIHPVTSVQPPYSMMVRDIESDLLPYCKRNNIGIISYSPIYKGLLTGKVTEAWVSDLASDDHRKKDRNFLSPYLKINIEFVNGLKPIAERKGITIAQLAIAWVIHHEEVTSAIVGSRKPEQLESILPASDISLDENDMERIQQLIAQRDESIKMIES